MLNFLVSYAYLRGKKARRSWERFVLATKPYCKHMLDSGGYSIQSLGLDIKLEDYIADLEAGMADWFWQYVALDVPLNWPTTIANTHEMVAAGLRPMTVLTADAPIEEACKLVEINPHICIAGGTVEETQYYKARLEKVFRITSGRARSHGLGFTRKTIAAQCKVYSIDSSTWSVGKQYGNFTMFDPYNGCVQRNTKRLLTKGLSAQPAIAELFMRHNVRMPDLLKLIRGEGRSRAQGTIIDLLSCRAWYEYSEFMRKRGVHFFFAAGSLNSIAPLLAVVKADLDGTPVADVEEYSWKLYDAVRDDFDLFLTEATDILRRVYERTTST